MAYHAGHYETFARKMLTSIPFNLSQNILQCAGPN